MNQMPHQADNNTVANTSPVHAESLPVTVAAAHITPQGAVQQAAAADRSLVPPKPATTGKAPVPTAAAAIQMEQEAAAGQARQSADKLLRKKRLGESEGDQNAESSADSSYDVVAANTTEAATPAEEAAAAGGSSAAASGATAWLPIAGGGLGLAAIGGGGGGAAAVTAAAVTAPTVSTFAVSIGAVAGPVTAALNYKIYDAQGNVVASGVTDAAGKVTANIPVTYAGQALLIKITDANGTAPDFRSETADAAGGGTSLGSTAFRAAFVATGSTQSITVSPVTELAVQKMGITTDAATASAATVAATNTSVGASLGVADILGAVTTVLSGDYNEANGLSAPEIYGQLLAKFDGYDHTSGGSVGATLAAFLAAISTVDPVARQTALNDLLTAGAAKFEAGVNTGPVTLINSPTLIITDSVSAAKANSAVTYTFTFSDAVTGFDIADIAVTNGTKGTFTAVSATVYTLVVTPTLNAEGADIGVTVNSGTGGIGHHSTLTATIAQKAGAQAYDTMVPAAPGTPDMLNASDSGGSNTDNNTVATTPTITGTAEANSTVNLYDGATLIGTGTATAGGTYSIVSNTLIEGSHTITATATDAAGNVSAASSGLVVTVDTTNPGAATINMVATDDKINNSEQATAITGTNEAGATVTLNLGGSDRTATVSGLTWSYTLTPADITAMGEGAETLTVTQTDAAGNTSTPATRPISVDTMVPAVLTINMVATDDTVNAGEQTATITGTNETDATVALTLGGNTRVATVTGNTWSYTLAPADIIAMGQGANKTLSVTQTDLAGNTSTAATHTISVDTQVPTVSTVALTSATTIVNGTLNAGDILTTTVTFSEAVMVTGTPQLTLDIGGTTVVANCTGGTGTTALTFSYIILGGQTDADGIAVMVNGLGLNGGTIKDAAGNDATIAHAAVANNASYMVDTTAPAAPGTPDLAAANDSGSSSTDNNTSSTTPTFTGTAEAGATVTLYDTDGTTVLGTGVAAGGNYSIISSLLSSGPHTITAKAVDAAGNVSTASSGLAVIIDTLAPTATIASIVFSNDTGAADFITATAAQDISGTTSANMVAGEIVEVSTNNGTSWTTATTTVGLNTWSLAGVTLTGSDTLKVRVTDTAGNTGTAASQAYVLDTTAPVVVTTSFNAAENGTTVATLTATDAHTVTWGTSLSGADAGLFSLTSGGVLTFNGAKNYEAPDDNGADRAYSITVSVTDVAGNVTAQAITVNLTDVNEAPTVANTIPAQTFVVGGAVDSFIFAANTFSDPDSTAPNNTLTYTATLNDGNALPVWLSFNAATRTFSGNPPANGATTVRVSATDGGTGNLHTFDDFVINAVTAPVIQSFSTATTAAKSGAALSFSVVFSEAVTVTGNPTLTFNMNGQNVTGTYSAGSNSNTLTFTATAPSGDGTAVSITAAADSGGSIIGNVSTQPWITSTVGQSITTLVIDNTMPVVAPTYFNAAENGTAVATLSANDTSSTKTWSTTLSGNDAALFSLTSGGVLTFNAAKNFEAPDDNGANHVYDITATVTDAAGNVATQALTVNLTNVNEAPTAVGTVTAQTAVTTQPYSLNLSSYFADVDAGDTRHYTATGLQPGLLIDGNTGIISGTASADHAASPVVVTMTDSGGLTTTQTFNFGVASLPALAASQALDNVGNLDVTSALVIAFDRAVSLNSTGTQHIKIFDDMGTAGWTVTNTTSGESKQDTFDNDVDITMTNGVATAISIGGVDYTPSNRFDLANSVKVVGNNLLINLLQATGSHAGVAGASDSTPFDWDFGANYHVNLDAGVVVANGQGNAALINDTTLNFTTVTPATAAAGAVSQKMDLTGASAGLSTGYTWHSGHVQDATSPGLALDFSVGAHALYIQSDGGNTKTSTMTGRVLISGMGIDDVLYNDNSGNMAMASTEGQLGALYGGNVATNNLLRSLNNSDSGNNQQVMFTDLNTGWLNVTSLNADNRLEDATHFNANVVIFG